MTTPEYKELMKLEAQRMLLVLRIKELENGTRPKIEEIFPTDIRRVLFLSNDDEDESESIASSDDQ